MWAFPSVDGSKWVCSRAFITRNGFFSDHSFLMNTFFFRSNKISNWSKCLCLLFSCAPMLWCMTWWYLKEYIRKLLAWGNTAHSTLKQYFDRWCWAPGTQGHPKFWSRAEKPFRTPCGFLWFPLWFYIIAINSSRIFVHGGPCRVANDLFPTYLLPDGRKMHYYHQARALVDDVVVHWQHIDAPSDLSGASQLIGVSELFSVISWSLIHL